MPLNLFICIYWVVLCTLHVWQHAYSRSNGPAWVWRIELFATATANIRMFILFFISFYFHYDFSFIRERRWIRSISIIIMTEWWWVDRRETANLHTYTQLLAIQFQMSSYKNVYKYEIKKENKIWAQPLRNSPEETQTIQMRKFYSPLIQSIYRFNWQEIIQYVLLHIYTYIRYMYDIRYACMQTTAASAHFVCDCDCDCLCNASLCHFAGHLSAK